MTAFSTTTVPGRLQRVHRILFNRPLFIWGPVVIYCLVIFALSSHPVLAPPVFFPAVDKFIHAIEYAVLGSLWTRAISQSWKALPVSRVLLSAVLFTTFYGISDEWHQAYVPGRTPEIADVLANMAGGILGSLGFIWFKARKKMSRLCL